MTIRLSAAALGAMTLLGGCSAGGPQQDLLVALRDAESKQPIAGARVRIETQEPRNPLKFRDALRDIMGSEIDQVPEATTGPDGVARMVAYTQLPANVVIAAPTYGLFQFSFGDHPALLSGGQWMSPKDEIDPFATRRLEARFTTTTTPAKP